MFLAGDRPTFSKPVVDLKMCQATKHVFPVLMKIKFDPFVKNVETIN